MTSKSKKTKKSKDSPEYNDGANVSHYLGNSDYPGSNIPDPDLNQENPKLEGKEAQGNDLSELDDDEDN